VSVTGRNNDRIVLYRGEEILRVEKDQVIIAPGMTIERFAAILIEIHDAYEEAEERIAELHKIYQHL
jgi:hypothetical protein